MDKQEKKQRTLHLTWQCLPTPTLPQAPSTQSHFPLVALILVFLYSKNILIFYCKNL